MFTIMVIEDSALLRHGLVQSISQKLPWLSVIGEADNGIQGKEQILALRPEIVLTDIRLPGATGLEMLHRVMDVYKPQVIVVSGYSEFEYAKDALSLGVLAYIVKPIDENELVDALKYAAYRLLDARHIDKKLLYTGVTEAEHIKKHGDNTKGTKAYYVNQVIRFIHSHYAEDKSIGDIAKALDISEDYLGRIFKEYTAFSINEYRNNYRIAQASKLLVKAELAVNEIARQVGIENQHYFSVLFKQKMGITPTRYRELALMDNLTDTMTDINDLQL